MPNAVGPNGGAKDAGVAPSFHYQATRGALKFHLTPPPEGGGKEESSWPTEGVYWYLFEVNAFALCTSADWTISVVIQLFLFVTLLLILDGIFIWVFIDVSFLIAGTLDSSEASGFHIGYTFYYQSIHFS